MSIPIKSPFKGYKSLSPVNYKTKPTSHTKSSIPQLTDDKQRSILTKLSLDDIARLYQKLQKLEQQHRKDASRIYQLEQLVQSLEHQNKQLRENSRNYIDQTQSSRSDMHSFFQDLYVTDTNELIKSFNTEISQHRTNTERQRNEVSNIRRNNFKMNATIKRYRNMLSEAVKGKAHSIGDFDERQLGPIRRVGAMASSMKYEDLEFLYSIIEQLVFARNMHRLCSILVNDFKRLLNVDNLTVFLISDRVKQLYTYSLGNEFVYIGKAKIGNQWVDIHSENDVDIDTPEFDKIEEIKQVLRYDNLLVAPVKFQTKDPILAVQCKGKRNKIDNKLIPFTNVDELLTKCLMSIIGIIIQKLFARMLEKKTRLNLLEIANVASSIANSRSHQQIANKVYELLPNYFDFEKVGIAFVDPINDNLFTMLHELNLDEFYGNNVAKFPMGSGISGQCVIKKEVMKYVNPKKYQIYTPDLDNSAHANQVRDLVVAPITTYNQSKVIAVLQLVNRRTFHLSESDMRSIKSLLPLISSCIDCANTSLEMAKIVFDAQGCIERVEKEIDYAQSINTSTETNRLLDHLASIKYSIENKYGS